FRRVLFRSSITRVLPIPGMDRVEGLLRAFLRLSVGLIDEVILAYIIRTNSDNPWKSAQTALVLYGQNAKGFLKNAAWLLVFTYGLTFLVFLLLLAPAGAIVYFMPGDRKSTRLNSSHVSISYAVFCLKKKN